MLDMHDHQNYVGFEKNNRSVADMCHYGPLFNAVATGELLTASEWITYPS